MKEKRGSIQRKFMLLLVLFAVVLVPMQAVLAVWGVQQNIIGQYTNQASDIAQFAASMLDGEKVLSYVESGETDADYDAKMEELRWLKTYMTSVKYLYVLVPGEDGHATYVFDVYTAEEEQNGHVDSGTLGHVIDYYTEELFSSAIKTFETGTAVKKMDVTHIEELGNIGSVYAPVKDKNGIPVAIVGVDYSMNAITDYIQTYLIRTVATTLVCVFIGEWVLMLLVRKLMLRPLLELEEKAKAYAESDHQGDSDAYLVSLHTGDEMESLGNAMNRMMQEIDTYISSVESVAAAREHISSELQLASDLQRSMQPEPLSESVTEGRFALSGVLQPAWETSGNFYDYFMLDEQRLCFFIGESTGKGLPAALFMVIAQTVLKSQMKATTDLEQSISAANRELYTSGKGQLSVILLMGVLDVATGSLRYVNAGHPAPLYLGERRSYEWLPTQASVPLAVNQNVTYRAEERIMRQGDRLFAFSRGVVDAIGGTAAAVGQEKLRLLLNSGKWNQLTCSMLTKQVIGELTQGAASEQQQEDETVLVLEYQKGRPERAAITVRSTMDELEQVQAFLKKQLAENHITGRSYAQTAVVVEEVFSVLCRKTSEPIQVECTAQPLEHCFAVELRGQWKPWNEADEALFGTIQGFLTRCGFELTVDADNSAVRLQHEMERIEQEG